METVVLKITDTDTLKWEILAHMNHLMGSKAEETKWSMSLRCSPGNLDAVRSGAAEAAKAFDDSPEYTGEVIEDEFLKLVISRR